MDSTALESKIPEIVSTNKTMIESGREFAARIIDRPSLEAALNYGKEIDRRLKWWLDEFMGPLVKSVYDSYVAARARRDEIAKPLQEVKSLIANKAGAYQAEEERKRKAEEASIQKALNEQAKEAQLDAAVALEMNGDKEGAEAVLNSPPPTIPVVMPQQPKIEGISTRSLWKFRIDDEAKIPREYLVPDEKKIGQIARALKDKTSIPGVIVWEEKIAAFTGR